MNQKPRSREWLELLPLRVYVTIGFFDSTTHTDVVKANRVMVDIGPFPDTAPAAALRLRNEIAKQKDVSSWLKIGGDDAGDLLYFMVYRTADMRERPYIFSDNSPEHAEAIAALKEKRRREKLTILQRLRADFKTWYDKQGDPYL